MPPVVVCGLGRFGLQVVEELRSAGADVVVLTDSATGDERLERATAAGARVVHGDFRSSSARREAGLAVAAAVVLTTSSDVDNLEAALEIRGEAPNVRVVMRHSEPRLSVRLQTDFGISAVLAPAILAADAFVDAALSAPVDPGPATVRGGRLDIPGRPRRTELAALPILLGALFAVGVLVFRQTLGLGWLDAAYFTVTTMTTVGYGDIGLLDAPPLAKLTGMALMCGGIVLIAMIASLLTNFVVSGAADQWRNEMLAHRLHGHVVVCGLGRVGAAVARDLLSRGIAVVVVDPAAYDDEHRELRIRCPVIVGDATFPPTLLRAGLDRARAVIACTSNDALNLEIGLTAQSINEERRASRPLRLVLRCFDARLARRIHAVSTNYTLLSEAETAAPIFVRHALAPHPKETPQ